jgi:hypothetical protein
MLNRDERGELEDLAADYLDALRQAEIYGPAPDGELEQSEYLLVSLLIRLMQEHGVTALICHGHRFALIRGDEQRVLHVACLNELAAV